MGAGAIGILWLAEKWALMPSFGWYDQTHVDHSEHGLEAGLFLGAVQQQWDVFAFPIGVRFEGRFGLGRDAERSLMFGGEFDSFFAVALPVAGYLILTADWDSWG